MTGDEIIQAMKEGFTLHSSFLGFWIMNPIDSRCTNVHNGAAKALVRNRRIKKSSGGDWDGEWEVVSLRSGDLVEAVRRIGYGLAEKGELMEVIFDRGDGWIAVKSKSEKAGFLVRESEIRLAET